MLIDKIIGWLVRAEDAVAEPKGPPPEHDPKYTGMPVIEVTVEENESPLANDEEADAVRRAAAVSLVEPDTYGYLLFRLGRPPAEGDPEVSIIGYVQPEWWPAFVEMCESTAQAGTEIIER